MSGRPNSGQGAASGGDGQAGKSSRNKQAKLVLLGDQGVGKSSIALRFVRGEFHENHEATIGGMFGLKDFQPHPTLLSNLLQSF